MTGNAGFAEDANSGGSFDGDLGAVDGSGAVRQIEPPADLLERTTLVDIAYQDCFMVDINPSLNARTAEQLARTTLEEALPPMRHTLVAAWKGLGLQLGPLSSKEHVLGWRVSVNNPEQVLLAADGRLGISGELLFERRLNTLRFATFASLDNRGAQAVWTGARPVHERLVRELLSRLE